MPDGPWRHVLDHVRRLAQSGAAEPAADGELLARFVAGRDESAFAALVERHGGMVFGVCRRVLRHGPDAEDAWQATFLALARQAASVRGSVGAWLHAVAYRTARHLRNEVLRRAERVAPLDDVAGPDTAEAVSWREVRRVLDEELDRLPDHYRAPLVLCYLEGLTQDEAARRLGWAPGVLRGRLDRGRERLRAGLTRRGLSLSAALLGTALADSASAVVPFPLVRTIIGAAASTKDVSSRVAALAEEVIRSMTTLKLNRAALALLAVVAVTGTITGIVGRASPPVPPQEPATQEKKPTPDAPAPRVVKALKDVAEVVEPTDALYFANPHQARLVVFKQAPSLVSISDTKTIDYATVGELHQLSLQPLKAGWATMYLWFDSPDKAGRETVLALMLHVEERGDGPAPKEPPRSKTFQRYVRDVIDPSDSLELSAGQSRLLLLKTTPHRVQVYDPSVADYQAVAPSRFLLTGKKFGTTVMSFWFPDGEGREKVVVFLVKVWGPSP